MEKFGIFELLDTLSALTAARENPEEQPDIPAEASPKMQADVKDKAFAPPPFPRSVEQNVASPSTGNAFSSLIARHENISKKIDGKK